jgi:hypothetical protein
MYCCFGFRRHVDWLVEVNVSEKRAVSIFRAELIIWNSERLYRVAGREV